MRIAQVAPLYESVPPKLYGGTERVVSYLTEELVRQGHDVTLYASGDSSTSARLRPMCKRALRLQGCPPDFCVARHQLLAEAIVRDRDQFDIVHFHLDYLPFPLIRRHGITAVTTLHGRLDTPELFPLFREFDDMHLISISDAQRAPMPWAIWLTTIHHGIPDGLLRPQFGAGEYLAFIGRISPEKGVDRAVEIARRAGMRLRIAAKVDRADTPYFASVRGLLEQPHVEFVGEIDEDQKNAFLANAHALLFPIDWPEPFGLVMVEALACATPVIAFRQGSVEEVLKDGVTAFIVDSVQEAAEAVNRISSIKRENCRSEYERRFSAASMCRKYVEAYELVIAKSAPRECRRA